MLLQSMRTVTLHSLADCGQSPLGLTMIRLVGGGAGGGDGVIAHPPIVIRTKPATTNLSRMSHSSRERAVSCCALEPVGAEVGMSQRSAIVADVGTTRNCTCVAPRAGLSLARK
jgi:hypothetical protein